MNLPRAFKKNSMKNGIETINAAFSILPIIAIVARAAPKKYVNESPGNIFAGYLL